MQSYKSLPHQIRRVFERRNAQKPEFYGVRRFAKRNAEELRRVTDFMACCSEKKRVRLVEENIPV